MKDWRFVSVSVSIDSPERKQKDGYSCYMAEYQKTLVIWQNIRKLVNWLWNRAAAFTCKDIIKRDPFFCLLAFLFFLK